MPIIEHKTQQRSPRYDSIRTRTTKRCTVCKITYPLANFGKNHRNSDGLQTKCKQCQKLYEIEYQNRRKERMLEVRGQQLETRGDRIAELEAEVAHLKRELAIARGQRPPIRKPAAVAQPVPEGLTLADMFARMIPTKPDPDDDIKTPFDEPEADTPQPQTKASHGEEVDLSEIAWPEEDES